MFVHRLNSRLDEAAWQWREKETSAPSDLLPDLWLLYSITHHRSCDEKKEFVRPKHRTAWVGTRLTKKNDNPSQSNRSDWITKRGRPHGRRGVKNVVMYHVLLSPFSFDMIVHQKWFFHSRAGINATEQGEWALRSERNPEKADCHIWTRGGSIGLVKEGALQNETKLFYFFIFCISKAWAFTPVFIKIPSVTWLASKPPVTLMKHYETPLKYPLSSP